MLAVLARHTRHRARFRTIYTRSRRGSRILKGYRNRLQESCRSRWFFRRSWNITSRSLSTFPLKYCSWFSNPIPQVSFRNTIVDDQFLSHPYHSRKGRRDPPARLVHSTRPAGIRVFFSLKRSPGAIGGRGRAVLQNRPVCCGSMPKF